MSKRCSNCSIISNNVDVFKSKLLCNTYKECLLCDVCYDKTYKDEDMYIKASINQANNGLFNIHSILKEEYYKDYIKSHLDINDVILKDDKGMKLLMNTDKYP